MSKQKKQRGRPRGSKTRPAPKVDQDLPRCPWCESTDLKVRGTIEREIVGVRLEVPFTSVIWRRCQCQDCNRFCRLKSYPFDPVKWDAAGNPPAEVPLPEVEQAEGDGTELADDVGS